MPRSMMSASMSGSMFSTAEYDAGFLSGKPAAVAQQARQPGCAGAFDDGLFDFQQQQHRLFDITLVDEDDVLDLPADDIERQFPGSLTAMPSAIVLLPNSGFDPFNAATWMGTARSAHRSFRCRA